MASRPLSGISVLVTRPMAQAATLAEKIELAGGQAIKAPMLLIAEKLAPDVGKAVKQSDAAIFISRNAAIFGIGQLADQVEQLNRIPVFAVGLGTAAQLNRLGVNEIISPPEAFNADGLAHLEALAESHIDGRRIIIFRGVGGREELASTLTQRGALVSYAECYERRKPDVVLKERLREAEVSVPDIGLATSMESLGNLVEKIEQEDLEQLFGMTMLAVGSRIAREVESLGFTQPPVTVDNPSDENIIDHIVSWVNDEL